MCNGSESISSRDADSLVSVFLLFVFLSSSMQIFARASTCFLLFLLRISKLRTDFIGDYTAN